MNSVFWLLICVTLQSAHDVGNASEMKIHELVVFLNYFLPPSNLVIIIILGYSLQLWQQREICFGSGNGNSEVLLSLNLEIIKPRYTCKVVVFLI